MKRWLQVIMASLILALPVSYAMSDYNMTAGSGLTVFSFTCFVSKICPGSVPITSAGVEISPATAALQTTGNNSLATIATNTGAAIPDCGATPCTSRIGLVPPTGKTSTQTKVTITTGGTYQQYLASNTSRNGCTIQFASSNTSTHFGFVFFGSAPADTTTSFALAPGQSLTCNAAGVVLTDAIQLTSSNNSDVFVVNSY